MISIVTWEEILLAEERGRKEGSPASNQTLKKSQPETQSDTESTILLDLNNKRIYKYEEVINKTGRGIVHSIGIKSASSAFGISIQIDNNPEYRKTSAEVKEDSETLTDMSAYFDNDYYYLSVANLKFKKSIKVAVYVISGTYFTFDKIHGKTDIFN